MKTPRFVCQAKLERYNMITRRKERFIHDSIYSQHIRIFEVITTLWLRPIGLTVAFWSLCRGGLVSWFGPWLGWPALPCQDEDTVVEEGLIARGGNSGGGSARGLYEGCGAGPLLFVYVTAKRDSAFDTAFDNGETWCWLGEFGDPRHSPRWHL